MKTSTSFQFAASYDTCWSCCFDGCGDLLAPGLGTLVSPVVAGVQACLEAGTEQTKERGLHRGLDSHGDTDLVRHRGGVLGADGLGVGAVGRKCPPGVVTCQYNLYYHSITKCIYKYFSAYSYVESIRRRTTYWFLATATLY